MEHQDHSENPLFILLMRASPPNKHGKKTIAELARRLGVSRWTIYRWVRAEKMEPENVVRIVDLAEGRVTISDFERFVYTL